MIGLALGALAGVLFGLLAVLIRVGLSKGVSPEVGAAVTSTIALALVSVIAVVTGSVGDGVSVRDVVVFGLLGLIVPGLSSIVFVRAIGLAGAARAAVGVGAAPLLSFVLAVVLLDERLTWPLVIGAVLIVVGALSLSFDRRVPEGYRPLGFALAVACAGMFAIRDVAVRSSSADATAGPLVRTVISLSAASLVLWVFVALTQPGRRPIRLRQVARAFAPAGLCLGAAYATLLVALDRAPVTIVAPTNATQALWGVVLGAAIIGRVEAVGPRLVAASTMIVAGGVLIGGFR